MPAGTSVRFEPGIDREVDLVINTPHGATSGGSPRAAFTSSTPVVVMVESICR